MGADFILQKRDRRDRIASSVHDIEGVRLSYAKFRGVMCRMNPVVYDIV